MSKGESGGSVEKEDIYTSKREKPILALLSDLYSELK